jgi:hypothetical protein
MVYIADRWMYFDATFDTLTCPPFSNFTSLPISGFQTRDYCHPYLLMTIPGAGITQVPEGSGRTSNSLNAYIISPPTGTKTRDPALDVVAVTEAANIVEARINGVACPVVEGRFSRSVPLVLGISSVTAQVQTTDGTFSDTINVYRWSPLPGDLNCDGVVDTLDIEPFVLALIDPTAYLNEHPDCSVLAADVNGNGTVNGLDVSAFAQLLIGG